MKTFILIASLSLLVSIAPAKDQLTLDQLYGSWESNSAPSETWTFSPGGLLNIKGTTSSPSIQYQTAISEGEFLLFIEDETWRNNLLIFAARKPNNDTLLLYYLTKGSELFNPNSRIESTLEFRYKQN